MLKRNLKVLVIDDQYTRRKMTERLLQQLEISNIDNAPDGKSALEKIAENHYDVILSELYTPGLNALQLLKQIRANDHLRGLPFIIVTAEQKKEIIVKAINGGVSGYAVRPVSAGTLEEKIDRALKTSEARAYVMTA